MSELADSKQCIIVTGAADGIDRIAAEQFAQLMMVPANDPAQSARRRRHNALQAETGEYL